MIIDLWYPGQTAALFDAARRGRAQHGAAYFPARYCEKPAVQQLSSSGAEQLDNADLHIGAVSQ